MPQDEGLDDARFPETPRGFGRRSRRDRVVAWLQWAAAPLGFFVFLVALTLFGLLKDEPTTGTGGAPATDASATPSTATPPVATTVPAPPTTTAAPRTEPPTTRPVVTRPPATEPSPESDRVGPGAGRPTSRRFGPVCGYTPGEIVPIVINGQPAPPATADAEGCVTVDR